MFEKFLRGTTLEECYGAVGEVANQWLDVLYSRGGDVDDDELMELISQNKTMSQTLEDYGTAKVRLKRVGFDAAFASKLLVIHAWVGVSSDE